MVIIHDQSKDFFKKNSFCFLENSHFILIFLKIIFREHLAETLKLSTTLFNNQLKSLTLSVLGEIFCAEHNEQAEKMLNAAYQLSKDANNDLGCLVSGRLLKGIANKLQRKKIFFYTYYIY